MGAKHNILVNKVLKTIKPHINQKLGHRNYFIYLIVLITRGHTSSSFAVNVVSRCSSSRTLQVRLKQYRILQVCLKQYRVLQNITDTS